MAGDRPFLRVDRHRLPRLDPASRRTLLFFGLKLGVILGSATIRAAPDTHPSIRFCGTVQSLAFLVGILATVSAYRSGRAPRDRMINQWDEAFAFAALGLLAKIGARLLAG
jgi:hypothetical protein